MITKDIVQFKAKITNGKLLGIDHGSRKIGIGITDLQRIISFPLDILENNSNIFIKLNDIIKIERISGIGIGVPLDINGNWQNSCEVILKFSEKLYEISQIPIMLLDERATTRLANTIQLSEGCFGKQSLIASKNKSSTRLSQHKSWDTIQNKQKFSKINEDFIKVQQKSHNKTKISLNQINFKDDAIAACQILDSLVMKL